MPLQEYVNTPEFRRTSRNIADDTIKRFFAVLGWVVRETINFIKEMVRMVIGK